MWDLNVDTEMRPALQDWRQAIRMPPAYRVGNSTLRVQTHFVAAVVVVGVACLIVLYTFLPYHRNTAYNLVSNFPKHSYEHGHDEETERPCKIVTYYNRTYPLTAPVQTDEGVMYRIGVISDLDTASKLPKEDTWISYLRKGYLTIDVKKKSVQIKWDSQNVELRSNLASGGRGMELSELIVFNGKLLTFDDRTGTVYEIMNDRVVPWLILSDGNGKNTKGFKSEWATVKEERLYIGGLGKEWTNVEGQVLSHDPEWIKVVTPNGEVNHQDWKEKYQTLVKAAGILKPGYMIHEAVSWSPYHRKWFFLPRRASKLKYSDKEDERRGTNLLLQTKDTFRDTNVITVGPLLPTHGFSSFKFVPNTDDQVIIALKSEENNDRVATYITVFTISGEIWFAETEIEGHKYEGIEFI